MKKKTNNIFISIDNPDLLELLLDYADDLEIRDGLGWTPLMTAVHRNSKENVKILLKRGAKIDGDTVKGMDLIATAMSFNNLGMNNILKLLNNYYLFFFDKNRTRSNSYGSWSTSNNSI